MEMEKKGYTNYMQMYVVVDGGVADTTNPFLVAISKENEAQNCAKGIEVLRLSGLVLMFIKVK